MQIARKKRVFYILLIAWLLTACSGSPTTSDGQQNTQNGGFELMENETLYAAQDTGQIIIDGDQLRIGVGNIQRETYTNAAGEMVDGVTTGLWLFFKDKPEQDQQIRAFQGQIIEVNNYKIRVVEINQKDGMVVLGIIPPPT